MERHHVLSKIIVSLLACTGLALVAAASPAAVLVHVAPDGDDSAGGTADRPLATLQGAQRLVRQHLAAGPAGPIDVVIAAGSYPMDSALQLGPADSGSAGAPVTWRAAEGADVVLSAGRRVTGPWTRGEDGVWRTRLEPTAVGGHRRATGLAPGAWNFRQLFVNGRRATRARFPNAGAADPFLYATGGGMDHVLVKPGLAKPGWDRAPDAQINIVPRSRFFNQWNTVTAVDAAGGRISLADSERHRLIDKGSWFWVEGLACELDEPGEWHLDAATGVLQYLPLAGEHPPDLDVVAPCLDRIVEARGDVDAGTRVEHVRFQGLSFRHTNSTLGHIEPRVHTDAVILFENAWHCAVTDCRFEDIGGYALWLHLDSRHNVFDGNHVRDSGGGGVLLTGARLGYMDDSKVLTPGEAASKVAPILNRITRNTVSGCGRLRYYGGGVHLDSRPFSMSMAPGNLIAGNHFSDLSRNGVFAFRNQGGNVIEYNHIHDAMQTTIDGGCVHFATMNTLTAPNFVLNNWLHDAWGYERLPSGKATRRLANGVFLDWDTSQTTVRDNWIHNTVGGAVKVIFGGNRNVVQTGNRSSGKPVRPPFAADLGPSGRATNGIDPADLGRIGGVVRHVDTPLFTLNPPDPSGRVWKRETAVGLEGLFEFDYLAANAAISGPTSGEAVFRLPVSQDGDYEVSLLYLPGGDRASKVPISVAHADGVARLDWNMRRGSRFGFAVPIGVFRFTAGGDHVVRLGTNGADGKVVADAVAFVKVEPGRLAPDRPKARDAARPEAARPARHSPRHAVALPNPSSPVPSGSPQNP